MTWVKICGITNLEDALVAIDAGADALGFVFYEKSPRYVTPESAREIVRNLPAGIESVGVFVNETGARIEEIAAEVGLTAVQLHGNLRYGMWNRLMDQFTKRKVYLVVQAAELGEKGLSLKASENLKAIFVDSGTAQQPGGTGKTFNWTAANRGIAVLCNGFPVVVAGGLNAGNVTEAISILKPWGVDVSSGVESAPGKKDAVKVKAFVSAVRGAEREQ